MVTTAAVSYDNAQNFSFDKKHIHAVLDPSISLVQLKSNVLLI